LEARGAGVTTPVAEATLLTIPLDKQYVPVVRNNRTVAHKTAYFGRLSLGGAAANQEFTAVFDTGSGHLFLPSVGCVSETCTRHRRYDASASPTAVDIDFEGKTLAANEMEERDQVAISYGIGEITGEFVRETVCLAVSADSRSCVSMRVIAATEMTPEPFNAFDFDGVLGLGLAGLALDPEFSFLGQLSSARNLAEDQFGYFLSRSDDVASEISFGGVDPRRVASELHWSPVHKPELGFWQVKVLSVTVAGEALPLCADGDCVGVADTGTSLLGVPRQASQRLHWLLARKVNVEDTSGLDCRETAGPDLVFELEGGVKLTLGPEDYSQAKPMQVPKVGGGSQPVCRAALLPVDEVEALGPKAWIFGEPVLRRYYTAYDWRSQRIGFAPAVQPVAGEESAGAPQHKVYGAPNTAPSAQPTSGLVV